MRLDQGRRFQDCSHAPARVKPGDASVVQDSLGRVVEIVELSVAHRQHKQHDEDSAQDQGDWDKEEYRIHAFTLSIDASTREAPQITMALDAGIRMAATSGLIRPAAAALTATIL